MGVCIGSDKPGLAAGAGHCCSILHLAEPATAAQAAGMLRRTQAPCRAIYAHDVLSGHTARHLTPLEAAWQPAILVSRLPGAVDVDLLVGARASSIELLDRA